MIDRNGQEGAVVTDCLGPVPAPFASGVERNVHYREMGSVVPGRKSFVAYFYKPNGFRVGRSCGTLDRNEAERRLEEFRR